MSIRSLRAASKRSHQRPTCASKRKRTDFLDVRQQIVPPCAAFSRARLRPGGPPPVRTLLHPTGIPSPAGTQRQELQVQELCTKELDISCAWSGLIWLVENPSSSLLWLDPVVVKWLRRHCPYALPRWLHAHSLPLHKAWSFLPQLCGHYSSLAFWVTWTPLRGLWPPEDELGTVFGRFARVPAGPLTTPSVRSFCLFRTVSPFVSTSGTVWL